MIKPEECVNIQQVRAEIDRIDKTIIDLIGSRYQYVKAAAQFKTSESSVKAPERFASMILQRREWGKEQGLNPNVIANLYTDLVTYFINEELNHWKQKQ